MQQSGFCWHVHHRLFLEKCYDHDGRAEYIRTEKPLYEQEVRLRLFQPVKGELPKEVIVVGGARVEAERVRVEAEKPYVEAAKAFSEAANAYREAAKDRDGIFIRVVKFFFRARGARVEAEKYYVGSKKDYVEAAKDYDEAGEDYDEAVKAFDGAVKAYGEALSKHKYAIEALHTQECLDCPWDGETIFPQA